MLRFIAKPASITPIRPTYTEKSFRFHSKYKEENNIDLDEGNSSLCSACNLPIFSTPFKATESGSGYLHDQCSNLPIDLDGNELHPSVEPLKKQPNLHESKCSKCDAVCGNVVYCCRDAECDFQLDVTCALPVKIMHRSHDHRLTVIRCSAGFSCSVCGTEDRPGQSLGWPMHLAYVCSACDYWLHPHCAVLPNAIQHECHRHPLLLNYDYRSWRRKCAICKDQVSNWGFYSCAVCYYHVHIMCAVKDDQRFEPVPVKEALESRVPQLLHLPVPDEYTSIIRYLAKCNSFTSDDVVQHQHPLTLHHDYPIHNDDDEIDDDDDDVHRLPKCNGCVQFISPPFYTCSQCPKLFLHDCCARLPPVLPHDVKLNRRESSSVVVTKTTCCRRLINGFTISSSFKPNVDIMCGLMPGSITHAAHAKTHLLRSLYVVNISSTTQKCRCCNRFLSGQSYRCSTCRNFNIHGTCASLPATVRHVYDRHPLELITAPPPHVQSQMETICDACEEGLDSTQWYYGCTECEQAFHVDCVPCLDQLSLIKYEIAEVRVAYHKCPLTLVRGHMVHGRKCGRCGEGYRGHRNSLAFACFKCYFSIHVTCFETLSELFDDSTMMTLSLQDL
ncbi:hypothetical protein SASPL_151423 [Salvia splendens]|uniref:DC1 domain-containing protein n=1 Tax=Salvia splendens TaxID=180675 RepID=A0A8X8W7Z8_SALSN|nr:uncharacterized protein LOC121780988 [Salvia splendens]KAG6389948.1 hypothetical protein SASPL_151423 [Salvia splendens]